jgi:Domain of unknown function (DUF4224)
MRLTLTPEEIAEITGYKLVSKQLKVLKAMGLPAFRRPDNTVSLGRAHYERYEIDKDAQAQTVEVPRLKPPRRKR